MGTGLALLTQEATWTEVRGPQVAGSALAGRKGKMLLGAMNRSGAHAPQGVRKPVRRTVCAPAKTATAKALRQEKRRLPLLYGVAARGAASAWRIRRLRLRIQAEPQGSAGCSVSLAGLFRAVQGR